jgi:hypothetical protein
VKPTIITRVEYDGYEYLVVAFPEGSDEGPVADVQLMPDQPYHWRKDCVDLRTEPKNEAANEFLPVETSLATLCELTPEQIARVRILSDGFKASKIRMHRDDYATRNVLFSLHDTEGGHILNGLIEADGRAHT